MKQEPELVNLIQKLLMADPDLTWNQIVDALWIASFTSSSSPSSGIAPPLREDRENEQGSTNKSSSETQNDSDSEENRSDIFVDRSTRESTSSQTVPAAAIQSPTGWALPNPRAIERALKPLKRNVDSRTELSLDVEATAQESAEQSYRNKLTVIPVFQPVQNPWLEVVLLVDNSSSMLIWQETADELTQILSRLGFRTVQVWHLETESYLKTKSKDIQIRSTTGKHKTVSPNRFLTERSNCLLLILSDCVAPAWQEDHLISLLAKWAKQISVTILQVFPESLWNRTVLRNIDIQVTAYEPITSNTYFKIEPLSTFSSEESSNNQFDIPIPVVALEPDFLSDWAKMLTGTSYIYIPATYTASLKLGISYDENDDNPLETKEALDPHQLVASFQAFASPSAQTLAGFLASVPLTLPVIRLIQTSVLKEQSKLVHLAEVITSGIVYLLPEASTRIAKNQEVFEFHDGVRDLLRRTIHTSKTKKVLDVVDGFIEQKAGRAKSFAGLIPDVRGIETLDLDENTLPFARLKAETLATLGPAYRSTVQILQKKIRQFEVPKSKVYFQGDDEAVKLARAAISTVNANKPSLLVRETESSTDADYYLEAINNQYWIKQPADKQPLVAPVPEVPDTEGYTQQRANQIIKRLEHIARWKNILELKTPATSQIKAGDVEMEVIVTSGDKQYSSKTETSALRGEYTWKDNKAEPPRVEIKVTNKSEEDLYFQVVELAGSFAIEIPDFFVERSSIFIPRKSKNPESINGEKLKIVINKKYLENGITEYDTIFKLIVSNREFNASLLQQPGLDSPPPVNRSSGLSGTLNRLMDKVYTRETEREEDEYSPPPVNLSLGLSDTLNDLMDKVYTRKTEREEDEYIDTWMTQSVKITLVKPPSGV